MKFHLRLNRSSTAVITFLMLMFCLPQLTTAQTEFISDNEAFFSVSGKKNKRIAIPFKLVNNLVILEMSVNGSEPLNFILDSGVGTMLITELPNREEVVLHSSRIVTLGGLGVGEPMKAFLSEENTIEFNRVKGQNIDILFLLEGTFNLSRLMGMYVHGLIGYDIFANFAVEINYRRHYLYLYPPEHFEKKFEKLPRHRKWNRYPILIEDKKPYINLQFQNTKKDSLHNLKLLIDSGSSNAFYFYDITSPNIRIPEKNMPVLIGVGLNGSIPGVLGQIEQVQMFDYHFKKPIVAYPDSLAVSRAIVQSNRNGSLGGEVLRRFKVIFHYQQEAIFLRANKNFKDDFSYNLSGIDLVTPIPSLPLYMVSKVRKGSIAEKAGIVEGDILDKVNGKRVEDMTLNEILILLERDSKLVLMVDRNGRRKSFALDLKNELKIDY